MQLTARLKSHCMLGSYMTHAQQEDVINETKDVNRRYYMGLISGHITVQYVLLSDYKRGEQPRKFGWQHDTIRSSISSPVTYINSPYHLNKKTMVHYLSLVVAVVVDVDIVVVVVVLIKFSIFYFPSLSLCLSSLSLSLFPLSRPLRTCALFPRPCLFPSLLHIGTCVSPDHGRRAKAAKR